MTELKSLPCHYEGMFVAGSAFSPGYRPSVALDPLLFLGGAARVGWVLDIWRVFQVRLGIWVGFSHFGVQHL